MTTPSHPASPDGSTVPVPRTGVRSSARFVDQPTSRPDPDKTPLATTPTHTPRPSLPSALRALLELDVAPFGPDGAP
jgi:hypothetical protein